MIGSVVDRIQRPMMKKDAQPLPKACAICWLASAKSPCLNSAVSCNKYANNSVGSSGCGGGGVRSVEVTERDEQKESSVENMGHNLRVQKLRDGFCVRTCSSSSEIVSKQECMLPWETDWETRLHQRWGQQVFGRNSAFVGGGEMKEEGRDSGAGAHAHHVAVAGSCQASSASAFDGGWPWRLTAFNGLWLLGEHQAATSLCSDPEATVSGKRPHMHDTGEMGTWRRKARLPCQGLEAKELNKRQCDFAKLTYCRH